MNEMTDQDWDLTYELAKSLAGVDTNIPEKLQAYLRSRKDIHGCRALLDAYAINAGQFLKLTSEQRKTRGVSFIRTGQMAQNYQRLSESLNRLFNSGRDVEAQARILGWVARLLKWAQYEGSLDELIVTYTNRRTRPHAGTPPSSVATSPGIQSGNNHYIRPNVKLTKQPPPEPKIETKREAVKLATDAKTGKALVRTEQGEEITCTTLPSYPPSKAGETFRAEITRENGKIVKCIFKAWV
jgi:hypothetical protein